MYWANFLHIYQPPTQKEEIVRKVADESYRKLVKILHDNRRGKITLNINACLTEQFDKYNMHDIIDGLKFLAERGQIEFTGSAKYHPILPLIPEGEIDRQIELNNQTNSYYFGNTYNPKGFFPPEMCYNDKVGRIVKNMGYKWIIMDEIGFNGRLNNVRKDAIYESDDIITFFKERATSAGITYGKCRNLSEFREFTRNIINEGEYLLSGTDGEVYGHHREGQERLLIEASKDKDIEMVTISELGEVYNRREEAFPLASSWSTWEDEMVEGIPFPQWRYPGNEIHEVQWQLAYLALDLVRDTSEKNGRYEESRDLLDRGLHSCQWWWASCRPWWDVGMIEYGCELLLKSVLTLDTDVSKEAKDKAGYLTEIIKKTAREWHEGGKAQRFKTEYQTTHRDVSSMLTFG